MGLLVVRHEEALAFEGSMFSTVTVVARTKAKRRQGLEDHTG